MANPEGPHRKSEEHDPSPGEGDPLLMIIPESEFELSFMPAGGPGGQHVNKAATKAVVRWCVRDSKILTNEQKAAVRLALVNRMNVEEDVLIVSSQEERSQSRNRSLAMKRLRELVRDAITPQPERRETAVPRREKAKRLEEKKRTATKKTLRKPVDPGKE